MAFGFLKRAVSGIGKAVGAVAKTAVRVAVPLVGTALTLATGRGQSSPGQSRPGIPPLPLPPPANAGSNVIDGLRLQIEQLTTRVLGERQAPPERAPANTPPASFLAGNNGVLIVGGLFAVVGLLLVRGK